MKYSTLSKPLLFDCQLKYRLGLAKERLEAYPLKSMDFVMMDLERPALHNRHADWCNYDLTGRLLQFYALAEGIDGRHIARLPILYERIMNNRQPNGTFTKDHNPVDTHFLSGLVEYYLLTGDMRALIAAREAADNLLAKGEAFFDSFKTNGPHTLQAWIAEGFADLYRETKDKKYFDACKKIATECLGDMHGAHSHGYMTTLRGIFKAGIATGDQELIDIVTKRRQEIIDENSISANGDVCEVFPTSQRNEGCSISDWVMLNLIYAYYFDNDEAYEMVENTLWNALFFNQFVTGGLGHRYKDGQNYLTYIEEAWWCCTPNAGMSFAEIAKHTVTIKDGTLKLNFFNPGRYTLPSEKGDITVTVSTGFPTNMTTSVKVTGTKDDIKIRVPKYVKNFDVKRYETDFGYELKITGDIGHYAEKHSGAYILKYGPLALAPMIYSWNMKITTPEDNTVPEGYIRENLTGTYCSLILGNKDENGFYNLKREPLPDWIYFEEGEMSDCGGGEKASCHVKAKFDSGTINDLYFQPLCAATTNLTLMDIPILFDIEE